MKAKSIYVLIVVILLVVLVIAIAKRLTKKEITEEPKENSGSPSGNGNSGSTSSNVMLQSATFPLELVYPNKRGVEVIQLQRYLNKKAPSFLSATIEVDGIFGPKTETLLYNVTGKKSITQMDFISRGIQNELRIL